MFGRKSKALIITLISLTAVVTVCAIGYYFAQLYVIRKMRTIITDDVKVQIEALLDELVEKEALAQLQESEKNAEKSNEIRVEVEKVETDVSKQDNVDSPVQADSEVQVADSALEIEDAHASAEEASEEAVLSDQEESLYNTARKTVPINDQLRGLELIDRIDINHALELAEPGLSDKEARRDLKEYAYSVYSDAEIKEIYELYHKYKYLLNE